MGSAGGACTAGLRGAAKQVLATLADIGRSRLELVTNVWQRLRAWLVR